MITEQDKKIGLSSPTRTGFAGFAQSIAVFTMSVSALPLHVWLSNPPSPRTQTDLADKWASHI